MNPLEHTLKFLESKKAELVLEQQIEDLENNFEDTQCHRAYESLPTENIIDIGDKRFFHEIDHQAVTHEAKRYCANSYQKVTNLINLLKQLKWSDFDEECVGAFITIDRSVESGRWPHRLKVIPYHGEAKTFIGAPFYEREPELENNYESFYRNDDFLELDKPQEIKNDTSN